MTGRFVVKIAQDGVPEPLMVDLGDMDQRAAEKFVSDLRLDTEGARDVGVPMITTSLQGQPEGVLSFDPRTIATIDLELQSD